MLSSVEGYVVRSRGSGGPVSGVVEGAQKRKRVNHQSITPPIVFKQLYNGGKPSRAGKWESHSHSIRTIMVRWKLVED